MKRLGIVICLLLVTSCANDNQIDLYNHFVMEINNYDKVSDNLPFDITVNLDKVIDSELTYRVIIDNPKEIVNNIKVIVVHNHNTDDIYPTSGIFEEPLNLAPDMVDLNNHNAKGIILIGYIDYDKDIDSFTGLFKVLVQYEEESGQHKQIYYEYHK